MRILLANDDGIDAPGLALLARAAELVSDDVWTVAPEVKHTAAGASLTMAKPLKMTKLGARRYSCSGRPADCIIAACAWLFAGDRKPDLVLAGINDGRNVAEDLAYSGTLGIAREATFWGIPAIGFSRVKQPIASPDDAGWIAGFVRSLWARRNEWVSEGHWLSVNLPGELPAQIRQPNIGRDKIGGVANVIETNGDVTVISFPRGRPRTTRAGDENEMIDAGYVTVNRLNWFGQSPLEQGLLDDLGPR